MKTIRTGLMLLVVCAAFGMARAADLMLTNCLNV